MKSTTETFGLVNHLKKFDLATLQDEILVGVLAKVIQRFEHFVQAFSLRTLR